MDHVSAATIAGPLTHPVTGHSYYLLTYNTWTTSENEAITLGGHLATINDAAENQWINDTFIPLAISNQPSAQGNVSLWIGLNDTANEGIFTWASGEAVSYLHWNPGQPNSGGGFPTNDQDYVQMYGPNTRPVGSPLQQPGFWNDYNNFASRSDPFGAYFGVVEIVPEPSALSLFVLGTFGSLLRRRRGSAAFHITYLCNHPTSQFPFCPVDP